MKKALNLTLTNIVILFLLISNTFAINLEINGEIDEYSKYYSEELKLTLECNEDILLNVPKNSFKVSINSVETTNKTIFINNCLNYTKLNYNLDILEETQNDFRLERNFNNYDKINYTFNLKVPLEYNIIENTSIPKKFNTKYYTDYKLLTFNQSDIFLLYFEKIDSENNQINLIHIFEELTESNSIILIIISFILGILITYIYMIRKFKGQSQLQVPSYILNNEEKKVLDVIKNNLGINQKQIGSELNMSKSRISHIISELEQKQLIKREKFGRSFKVYLNKKIV